MAQPAEANGTSSASMPGGGQPVANGQRRRTSEPPPADPKGHLAGILREQARACSVMGSPLYAHLLGEAARDVEHGGICWTLLEPHIAPGRAGALALRFMAAVHRLVLTRRAPLLARHYPSVGGDADAEGAWTALHATLVEHAGEVAALVALPCQTNEVGRAAALVVGLLDVAARTRLPLRCLEVGASAGLNLRWDRFRYGGGGRAWGPPDSPVDLSGHWGEPTAVTRAHVEAPVRVVERRGCDPHPVDLSSAAGRLALTSSVWADQTDRLARLRGALRLATQVPAPVDRASLEHWVTEQLAAPAPGTATVVYHSVVEEYLDETTRRRFHDAVAAAGGRAGADAPLAWLRLEPVSVLRAHGLTLTVWPHGEERLLAVSRAHGTEVRAP